MQPKIILASQSPRRRELFKLVVKSHGIQDFSIQAAEIDEKRIEAEILANCDGAFQETVKKNWFYSMVLWKTSQFGMICYPIFLKILLLLK